MIGRPQTKVGPECLSLEEHGFSTTEPVDLLACDQHSSQELMLLSLCLPFIHLFLSLRLSLSSLRP